MNNSNFNKEIYKKELGIYIHMPFCIKKCRYCDFLSFDNFEKTEISRYIEALRHEIETTSKIVGKSYYVNTIFIGGGTPSLLEAKYIKQVIDCIYCNFSVKKNDGDDKNKESTEVTIECNPNTITEDKLKIYKDIGINRLSIGVQSLDDYALKVLGRVHDKKIFLESYDLARKVGFKNINLDVMFGIPEVNLSGWGKNLEEVIRLNPEHISFYGLQIEEGTEFHKLYKNNRLGEPSKQEEQQMYKLATEILNQNGYKKYEISNASLKGYECKHNLKYWNMKDYIGLGLGAHSFLEGIRFNNTSDLKKYFDIKNNNNIEFENDIYKKLKRLNWIENVNKNDFKDNVSEFMITGLRKTEGISTKEFYKLFKREFFDVYKDEKENINKWIEKDYLRVENDRIFLTEKGIDVSNEILSDFVFI